MDIILGFISGAVIGLVCGATLIILYSERRMKKGYPCRYIRDRREDLEKWMGKTN